MSDPKPRPDNLKRLESVPDSPPIPMGTKFDDPSILDWCEKVRDHFEEKGRLITPGQLKQLVEKKACGLNADDQIAVRKTISKLYADEIAAIKAAKEAGGTSKPEKSKPKKVKDKPSKKKKSKPEPEPVKPKKKEKKMKTKNKSSKNGNGKSSKKAAPVRGGESVEIYSKPIKGIEVVATKSDEGKFNVRLGGIAIRKIAQWMGANQWIRGEAQAVLTRLVRGIKKLGANLGGEWTKGPEAYVQAMLNEGHLGSGAASKGKKAGSFGVSPTLDGSLASRFKKLRRSSGSGE